MISEWVNKHRLDDRTKKWYYSFVKVLSIKQPFASLICRGIKTIENRTWDTNYRGELLIHASGKPLAWPDFSFLPRDFVNDYQKYYGTSNKNIPPHITNFMKWVNELYSFYHLDEKVTFTPPKEKIKVRAKKYGYALQTQAIIGEVELIDIVKYSKDMFAIPGNNHWVLSSPILYDTPILNVLGKLRIWDYEM